MGKGFHLCHIHFSVQIDALGLFGKYHRHIEISGGNAGNADPGCLDGQDLVHLYVCKAALELLSHLLQETDIHLMV